MPGRTDSEVGGDALGDDVSDDAQAMPSDTATADPISSDAEVGAISRTPRRGADKAASSTGSQRSSRRDQRAASSAKNDRVSRKKTVVSVALTPAQLKQRAAARRFGRNLAIGIVLLMVGAVALWWFVLRIDKVEADAIGRLASVNANVSTITQNLRNKNAAAAQIAYDEAQKTLEGLDPQQRVELAAKKSEVLETLKTLNEEIEHVRRDERVAGNRQRLLDQFAKLLDPTTDLDKLEGDAKKFLDNPVTADGARSEAFATDYAGEANAVKVQMQNLASERVRRLAASTTDPVSQVQGATENLVKQEKFGEALAMIDETARKFPDAKLEPVRGYVTEAAAQQWTAVEGFIAAKLADVNAIGSTIAARKSAVAQAQARLKSVIDTFGIESYVSQAKALLAKFP